MLRALDRNAGSQPIRNIYTNPGFETVGSTVTVRTNLATKPRMTDASLGGYQTQTLSPVTGLTGNPDGITTGLRVSYVSGNVNPGAIIMPLPLTSTQYSLSAWVYVESADAPTIAFALKGVVAGGSPQTFTQNTWTKITWNNYTTPASLVTGNDFAIRLTGTAAATGSFIMTGIVIEQGIPLVGSFFDGATAAAGDFTYAWAGTANASVSYQRATDAAHLTLRYFCAPISSTDWAAGGTRSLRLIPNSSLNESFVAVVGAFGTLGAFVPGKTYTVMATLRLPAPLTGTLYARALSIVWRQDTNRIIQVTGANVAGIQQLRLKFTVGTAAANGFVEFFNGASIGGGDVWWDNITIVEGDYTGDHVDGTKPLSKWDGTANASTSVGYPQQLLDVAGAPALDLVGAGNSGGVTIPVDPFAPRTIYSVYETTGTTGSYNSSVLYGIAGSKGFMLQTASVGSNHMANRFDAPGGSVNGAVVHGNARIPRRHVAAFAFNQGLTSISSCADGAADVVVAMSPGTGWDDGRMTTSVNGELKAVRTLVFYAEHDRATRLAISRYLGNKYGAYVA